MPSFALNVDGATYTGLIHPDFDTGPALSITGLQLPHDWILPVNPNTEPPSNTPRETCIMDTP